jgi:hypothetical protein
MIPLLVMIVSSLPAPMQSLIYMTIRNAQSKDDKAQQRRKPNNENRSSIAKKTLDQSTAVVLQSEYGASSANGGSITSSAK